MTRRVIAAAQAKPKYIPAFTVEKLEGERVVTKAKFVATGLKDKNGNPKTKMETFEEREPLGYLVRTPKNGSVHIATYEELEANGFTDTEVPLVDEDGEAVGSIPNRVRPAKQKDAVNA